MFTEINKDIFELKEKIRVKQKLESLKNMVNEELKKKKSQRLVLEDILIKEERDVEKLETTSISSIFLSLIGKKEEKLDKEKEEYLTAKLKYEECLDEIKRLEGELQYSKNELKNYAGVNEEYSKLIKEKEELLIKEGGEKGKEYKEILDKINDLKLDIKEVNEAIQAGKRAKSALEDMKRSLDKAKGWGTWDMLGGGLISDLAKHSAIDEANTIAHNSQHLLRAFEKELSDVNEFTQIEVNLSSFASFADFFFDGIFADWFVQSKINDSLNNVKITINKIDSITSNLEQNKSSLQSELKNLESKSITILEQ